MAACPSGEKTTWPIEPDAVPRPRTSERFSGPTTRAIAASASEKAVKATPRPVRMPPARCSARLDSAIAMPHSPRAYITAPTTSTRVGP